MQKITSKIIIKMSTHTNIFYYHVDFSTFVSYQGDQTTKKCNLYFFFLEQYWRYLGTFYTNWQILCYQFTIHTFEYNV